MIERDLEEFLSYTYKLLAIAYFRQSKWSESEVAFTKCIELLRNENPDEHLEHYKDLAITLKNQGKLAEAEIVTVKPIGILVQYFGETHQALLELYFVLADIYYAQSPLSEAKPVYVRNERNLI